MAEYVTKIRTEKGDMQIDYRALANLPEIPTRESLGAAPKEHTHTLESLGASAAEHTHTADEVTGLPTSLPANGGNADTLGGKQVDEFALVSDLETLQGKVDEKAPSEHTHNDVYYTEEEVNSLLNNKENTFASGITVLSSHQYGPSLPAAGNKGRIFFKKVSG